MLFESRRILLGFRIKVVFEPSFQKKNSYVYVNVSKTQNISDLVSDIKHRFNIRGNICITLNECPLLESEDILVLSDASEVKVVRVVSRDGSTSELLHQEELAFHRDSMSVGNQNLPNHVNSFIDKNEKTKDEQEIIRNTNQPVTRRILKRRPYYGSIAETLRYLNQSVIEDESDNKCPVSKPLNFVHIEDFEKQKTVEKDVGVESGENPENDVSFDKPGDALSEKRRRKRKRKHSKKTKHEFEDFNKMLLDSDLKKRKEHSFAHLDHQIPHQHIFFPDEIENVKTDERFVYEETSNIGQAFHGNEFTSDGSVELFKKSKTTPLKNEDSIEAGIINRAPTKMNGNTLEGFETIHSTPKISFNEASNSVRTQSNSENTISLAPPRMDIRSDATFVPKKVETENCSNSFKSNGGVNSDTKTQNFENCDPLATLLMCKQLQTPVEYNVQFTNPGYQSRCRTDSSGKVAEAYENEKFDPIRFNVTENCQSTKFIQSDECEVLRHFKVLDDQIFLSDSNGTWNILSAKDASLKLQPIKEPCENQSVTFQILYLSRDLCPKMSNLMYGKVISFQKESEKVTLSISSAFINSLLKDCGEDVSLPEELVWITDNVYEVAWMAMKNARLLM